MPNVPLPASGLARSHRRQDAANMTIIALPYREGRNDRRSSAKGKDRRPRDRGGQPAEERDELASLHRILIHHEHDDAIAAQRFQHAPGRAPARYDLVAAGCPDAVGEPVSGSVIRLARYNTQWEALGDGSRGEQLPIAVVCGNDQHTPTLVQRRLDVLEAL